MPVQPNETSGQKNALFRVKMFFATGQKWNSLALTTGLEAEFCSAHKTIVSQPKIPQQEQRQCENLKTSTNGRSLKISTCSSPVFQITL
jgi:hypothetical protein